ncbi:MAG: major capsid protein, partial [Raoultibacter sp.]
MNIYEMLDQRELLDFSANYAVNRNYLGNTLFPDRKTENLEVEFMRLTENGNLPTLAPVTAWDTEAPIANRIPLEKVSAEAFLIEEKINQTARLNSLLKRGVRDDKLKEYVFDDAARRAEAVIARTEKAKMQALSTGGVKIKSNNIDIAVDFGVPADQKVKTDWSKPDADILGDIRKWRTIMVDKGTIPNRAITSETILQKMLTNKFIQMAIFGTAGVGTLPSLEQLNSLLTTQFQITVATNDARHAVEKKVGQKLALTSERYFPENVFSLISTGST